MLKNSNKKMFITPMALNLHTDNYYFKMTNEIYPLNAVGLF